MASGGVSQLQNTQALASGHMAGATKAAPTGSLRGESVKVSQSDAALARHIDTGAAVVQRWHKWTLLMLTGCINYTIVIYNIYYIII